MYAKAGVCLPEELVLNPEGGMGKPEQGREEHLERTWLMQDPAAYRTKRGRDSATWIVGIAIAVYAGTGARFVTWYLHCRQRRGEQ
jgi:hypothetical protein